MSETALNRLLVIMKQLRDPDTGCDWDKVQTYQTIAPHTLEETYEVLDAINRKSYSDLKEELGDLLFQIVFYARIAEEEGRFTFTDICQAISNKLERRHPHIFDTQNISAKKTWEQQKTREREAKKQYSVLDDIPVSLPALMRAEKIQKRCASIGFDWVTLPPVLDKVHEEIEEVMQEVAQPCVNKQKLEEEVGDLLFSVVNLARHLGIKSETALQKANRKFERRYRHVEQIFIDEKRSIKDASLPEMEHAWQQVKQQENKNHNKG